MIHPLTYYALRTTHYCMGFKKTEAIVIKAINLREADKIITFFSREYGKIQGIAKGIRKMKTRYSGKLELFTRVNVIFFQKAEALEGVGLQGAHPLLRVTQVDVVEMFPSLHTDFNKIVGASYIAEFLNKVFEDYDHTHPEVYALVCETLRTLAGTDQIRNILPAFEIKLLVHLGYAPILDYCSNCGERNLDVAHTLTSQLGFSSATGGVLCSRCKPLKKESLAVTMQAIRVLQQLFIAKMSQIPMVPLPKEQYQEIKIILTNYFQYHVGLSLKTETFVQKLRTASNQGI